MKKNIQEKIYEKYSFEVLQSNDLDKIRQTAEVMTDTFLGVQVGTSYIQEPMMKLSEMPKEAFNSYIIECLKEVAKDGLTVIAIDKTTNEVVGGIVSEYYKPGQEKDTIMLEGEQAHMNIVNLTTDKLIGQYMDDLKEKGIEVKEKEYIHLFLVGVRTELDKRYIGKALSDLLDKIAKEKVADTIFSYASNFRSQNMFKTICDYELALDKNNNPIVYPYENDKFFKHIPKSIAIEGQLVVKKI